MGDREMEGLGEIEVGRWEKGGESDVCGVGGWVGGRMAGLGLVAASLPLSSLC